VTKPSRHVVDRVARLVLAGRRSRVDEWNALADAAAARMRNRLAAAGVVEGGPHRTRGARELAARCDRETVGRVVDRIGKLLAAAVLEQDARAHAR